MEELMDLLHKIKKQKIICVGDIMLDTFVFGRVDRICPEAPVPVMVEEDSQCRLGGTGRVATMAHALGAECQLVSASGPMDRDSLFAVLVREVTTDYLIVDHQECITEKRRYMVGDTQIFRADREEVKELDHDTEATIVEYLEKHVPEMDIILVSDYGKGICTNKVMDAIWRLAKEHKKRWIVDPALGANPVKYNGASCVVPNRKKYSLAIADMIRYGSTEAIITTADKEGMFLSTLDTFQLPIPAIAQHVRDCIGASDQVLSMLGVAMASGATWKQAAQLANIAAGIKVGRGPVDQPVCKADMVEWLYDAEDSCTMTTSLVGGN